MTSLTKYSSTFKCAMFSFVKPLRRKSGAGMRWIRMLRFLPSTIPTEDGLDADVKGIGHDYDLLLQLLRLPRHAINLHF
jgi:hypothetical protein